MDDPGGVTAAVASDGDGDVDSPAIPSDGGVGPQVVPEADVFRFERVDRSGGTATDPPDRQGMTLVVDEEGIASSGPRRRRKTVLPWSEVTRVSIGDDTPGADGRIEVPIEVESSAGRFRYVVRSDRPLSVSMAALEVQVGRWGVPVERAPEETTPVPAAPERAPTPLPPPRAVPSLPVPPVPPELLDPSPEAPVGVSDPRTDSTEAPVEVTDAPTDTADPATEAPVDVTDAPTDTADPATEAPVEVTDAPTDTPAPLLEETARTAAPDTSSVGALVPQPVALAPAPPGRPKRTRRTVTLVVALALLISGVGLGLGLALTSTPSPSNPVHGRSTLSADQRLADQLMLTRSDLPIGWRVAQGGGATANSPAVQKGETAITRTLAHCMGISDSQASVVLGGRATDQTAQASSPIFVAPTASASAGSALELQSAASVVRSHGDEQADFALLSNPRYPQCAATAAAADLQLGVDQTAKGTNQPGPATGSTVALPGPGGLETNALLIAFSVKAGAATVSVQVESIWLGSHRVEANLQIFAIGGQIPSDTVQAPISTFQDRVASGGRDSTV